LPEYASILLSKWQGGNLADQKRLLSLLRAEEIGITLSGEDQLDPRAIVKRASMRLRTEFPTALA